MRCLESQGPATDLAILHTRHATQGTVSLCADGDVLFAHGHRQLQRTSHRVEPPALWIRQRHCALPDPAPDEHGGASVAQAKQAVVGIAGVPLTDDGRQPLAEGEVLVVRDGESLNSRGGEPALWPTSS